MASDQEKFEREERAKRLKQARAAAGFSGPKGVVDASGGAINENSYKAHEQGRNGFTVSDGRVYADLFNVSLIWLYLGIGRMTDDEALPPTQDEDSIRATLSRIQGLNEKDITVALSVIMNALKANSAGPEQGPPHDQSKPASRRHEVAPSRRKAPQSFS